MTKKILFSRILLVLLLFFSVSNAENNKGTTIKIDDCCNNEITGRNCPAENEKISAIWICNAVDLTGYNVTIKYDQNSMHFISAEKGDINGIAFLESEGAQPGPFMVIPSDGKIEIASGVKGKDSSAAPDGNGILVNVKFRIKDKANDCSLKITKALISDISLRTDTLIYVEE